MANITITYKCGHRGTAEAPRRQEKYLQGRASGEDCWPCQCAAENAQSRLDSRVAGLSPLVGRSEKQCAYGETCRAIMLDRLVHWPDLDEPYAYNVVGDTLQPIVEASEDAAFRGILRYLAVETDATFWCDLKSLDNPEKWTEFCMAGMGLGRYKGGFITKYNQDELLVLAAEWQPPR